jgi:hypothetical protein
LTFDKIAQTFAAGRLAAGVVLRAGNRLNHLRGPIDVLNQFLLQAHVAPLGSQVAAHRPRKLEYQDPAQPL